MEKYEDIMPTKQHALLICAYLEKINALLKEAGGDVLQYWYWTKTHSEYYAFSAWFYTGDSGCIGGNDKYDGNSVRSVRSSS